MKKLELIKGWQTCYKLWSVRLAAVGTVLTGLLVAFPDAVLAAWAVMPVEFKSVIPAQYMPLIGVGVFALSIVARVIKQNKLPKSDEQ